MHLFVNSVTALQTVPMSLIIKQGWKLFIERCCVSTALGPTKYLIADQHIVVERVVVSITLSYMIIVHSHFGHQVIKLVYTANLNQIRLNSIRREPTILSRSNRIKRSVSLHRISRVLRLRQVV